MTITNVLNDDTISVLIADDDPLALQALATYLYSAPDIDVVATASDGEQALRALQQVTVDILLVDIHMPKMGALDLADEVAHLSPAPTVLAITALDDEQSMLKILNKGVAGYILKSQTADSIIQSVRDAARGGTVISPNATKRLLEQLPPHADGDKKPRTLLEELMLDPHGLKDIEIQVLMLLSHGKSNHDIATELNYAESTVKKYVSRLMAQFSAESRLELVIKLLNPLGASRITLRNDAGIQTVN